MIVSAESTINTTARATALSLGDSGLRWFFALPQADFRDQAGNLIPLSDAGMFGEIAQSLANQIPGHYRPAFIGTGHRAEAGTLGLVERVRVLSQADASSMGIELRAPSAIMFGVALNAAGRAMDEAEELEYCSVGLRLGWTDETGRDWPAYLREFTATSVPWLKHHNIPARQLRGVQLAELTLGERVGAIVSAAIGERVTEDVPRDAVVAAVAEQAEYDAAFVERVAAGDEADADAARAVAAALGIDSETIDAAIAADSETSDSADEDNNPTPNEADMSENTADLTAKLEAAESARIAAENRAATLEQRVNALEMADRQRRAEDAVADLDSEFSLSDESRKFAIDLALTDDTGERLEAFVGSLRDARKTVKTERRAQRYVPQNGPSLSLADNSAESRAEIHNKALALKAERNISYREAVKLIDAGRA